MNKQNEDCMSPNEMLHMQYKPLLKYIDVVVLI